MNSQWISIDSNDGNNFKGYLTLPPAGKGPGLLLLQEIWGVNTHIQAVADQYAMDGYVVLAPDVFWRLEPGVNLQYNESDSKKAFGLMNQLDLTMAVQDLIRSVQTLRNLPENTGGVASLGFCMGGLLSYLCAANAGVDAAVCYYGGGIDRHLDQAAHVKCPILFHFAEKDQHISRSAVEAVQSTFANAKNALIEVYPGVDHGFNCWERPSYHQKTAAVAHGLSLSFLGKTI